MKVVSNTLRQLNHWQRNPAIFLLKRFVSMTSANRALERSPNAALDKNLTNRYRSLKIPENVTQATYLWIDGTGENIRGKDRVFLNDPQTVEDLPEWTYDGSSTYQEEGTHSDTYIRPRAIYRDPFKLGKKDILVMCDTYYQDGCPTITNNRWKLAEAYEATQQHEPWFGIEQEYTLLEVDGRPFGWPNVGFPAPQGPYYCSVGAGCAFGRDIIESHMLACLYAGITMYGTNAEVLPAQWEFQVGTVEGMKIGDDIWVARYILKRIAEEYGLDVSFDPKPIEGNWNGSGGHTNFSTKSMRADGGIEVIKDAIKKLENRHMEHIAVYDPKGGRDNIRRLRGILETSSIDTFTWDVGNRNVSVRIPDNVAKCGKGYFEDRRPSANCDPYAVANAMLRTCLMEGS